MMILWIVAASFGFLFSVSGSFLLDSWSTAASVSLLSSIIVGLIYHKLFYPHKHPPLPPTPPSWPLLGHLHLLGTLPHHSLQRLSQTYGPLFHLLLGSVHMVVVTSPEMIREFLKLQEARFACRPHTIMSGYFSYNFQDIILAPYGPLWQQLRKICLLELFSPRRLKLFRGIREEELLRMLHTIWKQCPIDGEVNIRAEAWTLMYNNISRMVMGKTYAGQSLTPHMFRHRIESGVQLSSGLHVGNYFPFLRWLDFQGRERRLKEAMIDLDAAMTEIVEEHRRARKQNPSSPPSDIIDVLLAYGEDNEADANARLTDTSVKLTDTNVKAVVLDLFAAGTDTTAVTTEWAFSELLRYPNLMEKAQEELDCVVGRSRRVQESDLSELPYLQAVVKETLRLHPPTPLLLPRQNEEACSVAGYFIPAKTRLVTNIWAIGRDARVWKDPLVFNPERFIGDSNNVDVKGQELHFIPFGTGRRICPGLSLGFLMAQMALATLLQSFNWSLPLQQQHQDLDMSENFGTTVSRAKPLIALPKPRLSSSSLYSFDEEQSK